MAFFGLFGPRVRTVPPSQAHLLVREGAQFVDVRNRAEYKEGHASGARNIALHVLPQRMPSLDPDKPVVVICHSGRRSLAAARLLVQNGFQVHNVSGGSQAWRSNGLPWTA